MAAHHSLLKIIQLFTMPSVNGLRFSAVSVYFQTSFILQNLKTLMVSVWISVTRFSPFALKKLENWFLKKKFLAFQFPC